MTQEQGELWKSFCTLRNTAANKRISLLEIVSYMDYFGYPGLESPQEFVDIITDLDEFILSHAHH